MEAKYVIEENTWDAVTTIIMNTFDFIFFLSS